MSYSSDDESLDETRVSNVQLGFIDIPFKEAEGDEPTIEDTFLGGQPIWLHENSVPDEKLVTCNNCGKKMALYLQAFAPLEDKLYDRVLYIFGCKNTQVCSKKKGSIKCIRGISKDPVKVAQLKKEQDEELQRQVDEKLKLEEKNKKRDELTKDLFTSTTNQSNPFGGSNPFGSNPFDKSGSNPFDSEKKPEKGPGSEPEKGEKEQKETYASVSAVNADTPKPKKQSVKLNLPEYPGYFVYVTPETFKTKAVDPEVEKYKHLLEQTDEEGLKEGLKGSGSLINDPQMAKLASMLEDKVFANFSSTIDHNTSQILRYELGGKPLLYNGKDEIYKHFSTAIPKPGYNPSSNRRFELQMMPKAIMDLEQVDEADIAAILNGMAWGTIIACTDEEDYIPELDENHVGYVEEYCGVQWEESV